jgi:hypothetical protein
MGSVRQPFDQLVNEIWEMICQSVFASDSEFAAAHAAAKRLF